MIDGTTLFTYCAIVLGFVFIPGPATLLTVARATTSGAKVGIATGAGITFGDILHTIFAVIGLSAIIAASATLFSIIKFLGAAYLIWLGIKAFRDKTVVFSDSGPKISASQAFRQAVLAEVLNPKTALFFLAFLPQFVQPESGAVFLQFLILGTLFSLIGFASTLVFALGASGLGRYLRRHPAVLKWQGKVVGGIYLALGLRLAMQHR